MSERRVCMGLMELSLLVSGMKTQFRRPVGKMDYQYGCPGQILFVSEEWRVGGFGIRNRVVFDLKTWNEIGLEFKKIPVGKHKVLQKMVYGELKRNGYPPSWEIGHSPCRWRPASTMPKQAARYHIEVIDVRKEHLHEMTGLDAVKEGYNEKTSFGLSPDEWYWRIWQKIAPDFNQEDSPLVWVVDYKMVDKIK